MVDSYCNGEPSIQNMCPNKHVCERHIGFVTYKSAGATRPVKFESAFICRENNFNKFVMCEPFDDTKVIVLENQWIIRDTGKRSSLGLKVYKRIIPKGNYPLVSDGLNYYTTNNLITLEPIDKVTVELEGYYANDIRSQSK